MWIYAGLFLLSWLFARASERSGRLGRPILSLVCAFAAVLAPTSIAGLRDLNVGTDTSGYVLSIYTATANSGQSALEISDYFGGSYEIGYLVAAQVARLVPSVHSFLTIIALITFGAAFIAARLLSPSNFALTYLAYLLMHFNESLNMSRQSVSIAFGLLAAAALIKRRRLLAVASAIAAVLFHESAVLIFLFFPMYWASEWRNDELRTRATPLGLVRDITLALSLAIPVIVTFRFDWIVQNLLEPLGLPDRYGSYLAAGGGTAPTVLVLGNVILALAMILRRRAYSGGQFIAVASLAGAVMYLLTGTSEYLWRVSSYFLSVIALGAAGLRNEPAKEAKDSMPSVRLIRVAFVATIAAIWLIQIVVWNNHETVPYTSQLLGIR